MELKKTLTITLQVRELVYDIQNKTYLTGRSREAEGVKGYEAASHIQVSDDDENSYQIRRSINNAFADLKTHLAEYLDESTTTTDNLIRDAVDSDTALQISLKMPSNYNLAATDNIGTGLHQYMVDRAVADWYFITDRTDADDYVKLAADALERVKRSLYKRSRPARPTYAEQ